MGCPVGLEPTIRARDAVYKTAVSTIPPRALTPRQPQTAGAFPISFIPVIMFQRKCSMARPGAAVRQSGHLRRSFFVCLTARAAVMSSAE